MSSSTVSLLTSFATLGLYSYSMYYLHTPQVIEGFAKNLPKAMQIYGNFKFLTVQCLLIQLVNSLLHVLAHFIHSLRGARDFVFTTLAQPIGSVVVYTFWIVWFGLGREHIFPHRFESFYPFWLNVTNHIVFVPVNIILAWQVNHKYIKNGFIMTLVCLSGYLVFLHVFEAQTGMFVYPYLDIMNGLQRQIYFASTTVLAYFMYEFGRMIKNLTYGKEPPTI